MQKKHERKYILLATPDANIEYNIANEVKITQNH